MIKKETVIEKLESIKNELIFNSDRDIRKGNWKFKIENEVLYGENKYHVFDDERDNYIGYVYFKLSTEKYTDESLINGFYIDIHISFDESKKTGLETPMILNEIENWIQWSKSPHYID